MKKQAAKRYFHVILCILEDMWAHEYKHANTHKHTHTHTHTSGKLTKNIVEESGSGNDR